MSTYLYLNLKFTLSHQLNQKLYELTPKESDILQTYFPGYQASILCWSCWIR